MNEFEKEYYESDTFWEGEMLQDPANRTRINFTAKYVPTEVKSLADIGCGNGVFVNHMKKERPGLDIMAIDRSATALKYVETNKKEGSIFDIPLEAATYDCVCCLEVIEHLPVPVFKHSLKELARISGKYIIISVPFEEDLELNHNQCPACKTIFNQDLHMRSFSKQQMETLMEEFGFRCVKTDTLGEMVAFKGHYQFRKIFYSEQFRQWRSPICPLCGYETMREKSKASNGHSHPVKPGRSMISYFTALPKLIWPKSKKDYWIIGLYTKVF
ncbi:MAG TPA: class I SAM-dependent methyltransferase [Flavitalea sp.]|nr:class I SAM-dependent methyltransferase [Flavitalea sp.]